jgi:hypothetical protein
MTFVIKDCSCSICKEYNERSKVKTEPKVKKPAVKKLTVAQLKSSALKAMTDAREKHGWSGRLQGFGDTGGDNALFGAIGNKVKPFFNAYPCHAQIKTYKSARVLWSAYGFRAEETVAHAYHHWLMYDSPWAKNNIVPKDSEDFLFNNGLIWTTKDLKKPANLLHNFLVASRMDAEWPHLVTAWHKLVTVHNVNPELAFVFLTTYVPKEDSTASHKSFIDTDSQLCFCDKYDWPLDMARATEDYVRNFCSSLAVKLSGPFYPTANTTPVNEIWGTYGQDGSRYINVLKQLYKHLGVSKTSKSQGSYYAPASTTISTVYTPEIVLQIIKLEEIRLGLAQVKVAAVA